MAAASVVPPSNSTFMGRVGIVADPWLSIIGMGEDGLNGLPRASRDALDAASVVFGAPRHLELAQVAADRARAWPVPFSTAPVLALRGQSVAVLASGDPFWFGAGGSLARDLAAGEWRGYPVASTFGLVCAALGWGIEATVCLGLHASPFATARAQMHSGRRVIALVADAGGARDFAGWLTGHGFGASTLWLAEAMGGPRQRLRVFQASDALPDDIVAPVAVAVALQGSAGLARSTGLDDDLFDHDGQITKRPFRALALSALAPRPGQHLWDIGAGSGSISVEWCLAGGTAHAIELNPERIARIHRNSLSFGVAKTLQVVDGPAPAVLAELPRPDAVFIGGGASDDLIGDLWNRLGSGCRLVAHAVTLETESLLMGWHARVGGDLLRIDIAQAAPLGGMRGWDRSRPVVQWRVTR
jgi:precorrin-6B C5,15-methyltransferase / cobalt-precorrin-6B C5,C15-methyltransferase